MKKKPWQKVKAAWRLPPGACFHFLYIKFPWNGRKVNLQSLRPVAEPADRSGACRPELIYISCTYKFPCNRIKKILKFKMLED